MGPTDRDPPLLTLLRRMIAEQGPISVAAYMALALGHPRHGYYMTRDPFGARGDFITAPEISQLFGECLAVWCALAWAAMGRPAPVPLVELGPGRGTLLADLARTLDRIAPDLAQAAALHLIESSPVLRRKQEAALRGRNAHWHDAIAEVPPGAMLLIANEFFDALPVYQAVKRAAGWHERVIQIGPNGDLVFGVATDPFLHFDTTLPRGLRQSPDGSIYEWRSDRVTLELGRRVRTDGAALIVDYGHAWYGLGETLQAVAGHEYADPLRSPGHVDLTAHVDFRALAVSAETIGARIHGPVSQRDFLRRLGIDKRAAALKTRVPAEKEAEIDIALARLTATGTGGMGELFKALAIADPRLGQLPGFYP